MVLMLAAHGAFWGHAWTVGAHLAALVRPPAAPPSRRFRAEVTDPRFGKIALTGELSEPPGARALLVVVHGLGGSADSAYVRQAAALAAERGLATLRLNLRGADRSGEDVYHAGLTADLAAALSSPELSRYGRCLLLGYSLGGHVAIRFAAEVPERVEAVAAVCAPLDLSACATFLDAPGRTLYRRHVLGGLREIYRAVAARRDMPLSPSRLRTIRTLRGWDDAIVAPRFGFDGAADYYRRESAGPRLRELSRPALFVAAEHDPMVPAASLRPHLTAARGAIETWWIERGGHVGFPPGQAVEARILDWLTSAA